MVGLTVLADTTQWEDGAFVAIAELTGGKWLGDWMVEPVRCRYCPPRHRMPFNAIREVKYVG
jgi:hypothetical protein